MVETVKHAIVLLQIAKNASCPGPQGGSTEDIARVHGAEKAVSMRLSSQQPHNYCEMLSQVDTVEEARENVDSDSRSSNMSTPTTTPASVSPRISPAPTQRLAVVKPASHKNSNTIPGTIPIWSLTFYYLHICLLLAVSYSSSDDDEDDFFDAHDDVASKASSDIGPPADW